MRAAPPWTSGRTRFWIGVPLRAAQEFQGETTTKKGLRANKEAQMCPDIYARIVWYSSPQCLLFYCLFDGDCWIGGSLRAAQIW